MATVAVKPPGHSGARVIAIGRNDILVDAQDYNKVSLLNWHIWSGYATCGGGDSMHKLIMGERPTEIPIDYIIDHADRNRFNNCRSNLRYVSRAFNSWNAVKQMSRSSKFRGVYWKKDAGKWAARLGSDHLGSYKLERDAALAVAREAIRKWPLWSPNSDILVGPDLLSEAEIGEIQKQLETPLVKAKRILPRGVQAVQRLGGEKYLALHTYKRVRTLLGVHDTVAQAELAYQTHVRKIEESEWIEHLQKPITRDERHHAVIRLEGKAGMGKYAIVDDSRWHGLTFQTSWCARVAGDNVYPMSRRGGGTLHTNVFKMVHSDVIITPEQSIDHINGNTLDNRICNLRIASRTVQNHNKRKRQGCISDFLGVSFAKRKQKWTSTITYERKVHCLGLYSEEEEAAKAYDRKALELYGEHAQTNFPLDESVLMVAEG